MLLPPALLRTTFEDAARGVRVRIREVTALERIDLAESVEGADGDARKTLRAMARFLCACVEGDAQEAFFADEDAALSAWPLPLIEAVFDAAVKHNGFDTATREAVRKNSEAASAGPPTVSPSPLANGTLTASSPA